MNPPYTRTKGRDSSALDLTYISDRERSLCQKRWGNLIRNKPAEKTAGMAASFLVLANQKLKFKRRMGFVLPITFCRADSWSKTRQMMELEFDEIIVIAPQVGSALGKKALSADTNLAEMMLVAKKKPTRHEIEQFKIQPNKSVRINCVTLHASIIEIGRASIIANEVTRVCNDKYEYDTIVPIKVGNENVGVYMFLKEMARVNLGIHLESIILKFL